MVNCYYAITRHQRNRFEDRRSGCFCSTRRPQNKCAKVSMVSRLVRWLLMLQKLHRYQIFSDFLNYVGLKLWYSIRNRNSKKNLANCWRDQLPFKYRRQVFDCIDATIKPAGSMVFETKKTQFFLLLRAHPEIRCVNISKKQLDDQLARL